MSSAGIRMGIIGAGRVGVDWHLPAIEEAGGTTVALGDAAAGRAARGVAHVGIHPPPLAYDSLEGLIADPRVDAVAICTPPPSHEPLALAVIEADKHLYLEKPPTMTAREMRRVRDAASRRGVVVQSGSNNVYLPDIQYLRGEIVEGRMGTIYAIEARRAFQRGVPHGWHREREAGGGVAMNSTAHRIDCALFLTGDPRPRRAVCRTYSHFASMTKKPDGYLLADVADGTAPPPTAATVEDALFAMVQLDDDTVLTLRDLSISNGPEEMQIQLYGTAAGATVFPLTVYRGDGADAPAIERPALEPAPAHRHTPAYRRFFASIAAGDVSNPTADRSVAVMQIIDALYRSAREGGTQVQLA